MTLRTFAFVTVVLAFSLGVWARSAALTAGFWSDDYLANAILEGVYPSQRPAWDQFRFIDGSRGDRQRLVDYGYYPWWTHPDFRLAMLRPLPSLLTTLDYALFGSDARAQHWVSFMWWGLMLVAVAALLFALLPRGAAAAAVVCFAFDESHTVPLVWLSNRSLIVATTFAAGALLAHIGWRRSGVRSLRVLSVVGFALALASGEYALAMFGYLVCFELSSRFEGASRRRALAPAAVLGAGFLGLWILLGYGTAHSGLYANPLESPLAYLLRLGSGLPVLLGDLTLGVPADWWSFGSPLPAQLFASGGIDPATWEKLPSWHSVQIGLGLFGALLALLLLYWLRATLARDHARNVTWLFAGAVASLLPVLGSFVTTRLVLPASIGVAALFGSAFAEAARGLRSFSWRDPLPAIGLAPLMTILAYAQGYLPFAASRQSADLYSMVALSRTVWPMKAELDDTRITQQRVVMVAAADANDAPYLPFVRLAYQKPLARGFRLLSGAFGEHEMRRIDPRTLELHVIESVGFDTGVVGSLTRGANDGMLPGQHFEVSGMQVEILETIRGQPVRMRYTFDVPLEDPSLVWLQSTPTGLRRLILPAVGTSLQLAGPAMPNLGPPAAESAESAAR